MPAPPASPSQPPTPSDPPAPVSAVPPVGAPPTVLQRYHGAFVGLAVGDALGTTNEFAVPGSFKPIIDMVGGGPFGVQPGEWTADTSMALCLALSLLESGGHDPHDQMQRYGRWSREGYCACTGRSVGVGGTLMGSLSSFMINRVAYSGPTDRHTAGNSSLARLAPVPLYFAFDPAAAIIHAANSSRTTHGAPQAVDACRYVTGLIIGALGGASKAELLTPGFTPVPGLWELDPLDHEIVDVLHEDFAALRPPRIAGAGYVVKSLEAALWSFATTQTFRDGCLKAANLGDDANSTAAIYGQIAGAYYGVEGIPHSWRARLAHFDSLETIAGQLLTVCQHKEAKARQRADAAAAAESMRQLLRPNDLPSEA